MARNRLKASQLIARYKAGTCTEEEKELVEAWYTSLPDQPLDVPEEEMLRDFLTGYGMLERSARHQSYRQLYWTVAASMLLLTGIGLFLYQYIPDNNNVQQQAVLDDVPPGTNRATLTLADGRTVTLDEAQEGIIIADENITYIDGSLLDVMLSGVEAGPNTQYSIPTSQYAILTTPKGGTYQITLPDGSNVWLNAATTLKYPPRFDADQRRVEISGEAYFSVAKDSKRPFKVISDGQEIEVLGTEFNVSAYEGETETRTTLVQGAVRLSPSGGTGRVRPSADRGRSFDLKPGEQAIAIGGSFTKEKVDLEPYIAWQKGDFHFSEDLESVMKQVGRWYDVEIEFRDESLKKVFVSGSVLRSRPLSELLTLLEDLTGAKFTVMKHNEEVSAGRTERRIVIMK